MPTYRLDTVDGRSKLKPRHAPYYSKLLTGCSLGFRKTSKTGDGSWVTRYRDPVSKQTTLHSLGSYDHLPNSERFDAAKRDADQWFTHLGQGGATKNSTVEQACNAYVEHIRATKGTTQAGDLDRRYKKWVHSDKKLALTALAALARGNLDQWRQRVLATPVRVNYNTDKPITRPRSAGTVNRDMTALRAALNHALDTGQCSSDRAWRLALKPTPNADKRRELYLDRAQRRKLLDKAPAEVRDLLWGMSMLPLRPGPLAALVVASFDPRHSTLKVGIDKGHRERRIPLPPETAARIATITEGRPPEAPLFPRPDGKAWRKEDWKVAVKQAAAAAELPSTTVAYTLRHSVITDLVTTTSMPLLSIAQISGTSVRMIELYYGHLRSEQTASALGTLTL